VSAARPGDLFFFGDERVTHTAIATGEREFLHAPQSNGVVERATLSPTRNVRAIRRYLPDEM
jgi:cell wall-associated NlpC family hydrolase